VPVDDIYVQYLRSQSQGRLATIGGDGSPQNKPVGYRYNAELGTIDIGGFNMEASAKYRNVAKNPQVSFVVDDAIGEGPPGMRFVEVRGRAEAVVATTHSGESEALIRIHPSRIVSWNVGPGGGGFGSQDLSDEVESHSDDARPLLGMGAGVAVFAEAAVANLVAELQEGWDRHDPDITNRHFATDIVWGSPFGATLKGFEDLHAIHQRLKKEGRGGQTSRFEIVEILAPTRDVVVAQIRRVALDSEGAPVEPTRDFTGAFSEVALCVLVRHSDAWWVVAGQNTPVTTAPGF
jgi:PPOX class F420-dependent enzyme/OxyR family protein/uncharacterized protein (TIGR02246 family)